MCGIFGITENNEELIRNLIKTCSYRGPDASDIFLNDNLTLGHNLLSITSNPQQGKQPWITPKNNVLVFNGEIFNYNDLKINFKNKFLPKTTCDTELLSWLLDEFSYEFVIKELLDSMHSFVFFNKANNEIVLSRDHVGIKPLFFANTKSGIMFSSEIKGLLSYVNNSNKIDRLALACTSLIGVNVLRQTIFSGIYKVLPGEPLIYDLSQKKIKKSFRTLIKPHSNKKLNNEEFSLITEKTIKDSSIGIRKFGIFLSGGIDSSLITYELQKHLKFLEVFTNKMSPNAIIKGEDHNSDFNIAKQFSNQLNINHKEVKITPDIIINEWDNAIKTIEEPRYNWNLPMYYFTNKFLSKNNVVVTMAGDIGDEIYGGYSQYYNFKHMNDKPQTWRDFIKIWMKKFASPIDLNMKFDENDLQDILIKVLPEDLWNPDDIANSAMALDCITTVSEDFFSRNDRFGMAFSMEGRFPLASKKYMEYCLSINSDYKIGNNFNQMKLPIKICYKDKIPNYVLNKYKTGWSLPITEWLMKNDNLKNKYLNTVNKDDGIKELLSKKNYEGNLKRVIVSWMFRTWAQQYSMNL